MNDSPDISAVSLLPAIRKCWDISAKKIRAIEASFPPERGAPVFTVRGAYTARGWTEWTQGFRVGSALLQYEATGTEEFRELGLKHTIESMAVHLTHFGVHDHGFNNVSTYGNLLRLLETNRFRAGTETRQWLTDALRVSGAVQAHRWTDLPGDAGYIYSFNGPHSLFSDTLRSLRSLALAHRLGHVLMVENDRRISFLERLLCHAHTTIRYNVYFGEGRDLYDIPGRVAHESLFNLNDGCYRCPSTQQGYSPFSTWTRGLAWILCGCAEQLEFMETLDEEELEPYGGRTHAEDPLLRAARATAGFYLAHTPSDGVPYWDTGAPGLAEMGCWRDRPAEPENDVEPVDSSAAAIACQGFLRLGRHLERRGAREEGRRFTTAALSLLRVLLHPPYLSEDPAHQGLLLHSVYHRPNGWDHVPEGRRIPCGESSQWGDYHLREAALCVQALAEGRPVPTFWGCEPGAEGDGR